MNRKGGIAVSEKEKQIMETLAKVVKEAPERSKDYLLGWAEGAAYAVCGGEKAPSRDSA